MPIHDTNALVAVARVLLPEDTTLLEEIHMAVHTPGLYIKTFWECLDHRGISEPIDDLPWIALTDGLCARSRLYEADWKEAAHTIMQAIHTMIRVQGGDWLYDGAILPEDTVSDELLRKLGDDLIVYDFALISLDLYADSYPLSVVHRDQVTTIQRLVQQTGYGTTVWWKH